jgi:hypothetical protein
MLSLGGRPQRAEYASAAKARGSDHERDERGISNPIEQGTRDCNRMNRPVQMTLPNTGAGRLRSGGLILATRTELVPEAVIADPTVEHDDQDVERKRR